MDKAIVLAFWIEEYQDKGHFTSAELKSAFANAREPAPANPSDVVAKLEGAGKFMRAEKLGKSQYYRLTQTGIDQVHAWLNPSLHPEDET